MTKNLVNSDTFVILYYNPQMAEDGELMSLHADSSCQLLGGKVENPSMPSTLFFFVCLFVLFCFVLEPHSIPIPSVINSVDFSFLSWYVVFYKIWY